jgi:AcrR family transcriptional regulator
VTSRGERTREKLLDAAELLYGERGVDAVSFREIRLAAGQRNTSALQFHFGDRGGLLLALAQRHLPRLEAIREDIFQQLVTDGRLGDDAALVEVLVRPNAEYIGRGQSARAWIKISADLSPRPETELSSALDHASARALEVGKQLYERLAESMEPELAVDRIISVSLSCQHLCADRARVEDSPGHGLHPRRVPFEAWRDNLIDMAVGAMFAEVGATSRVRGRVGS